MHIKRNLLAAASTFGKQMVQFSLSAYLLSSNPFLSNLSSSGSGGRRRIFFTDRNGDHMPDGCCKGRKWIIRVFFPALLELRTITECVVHKWGLCKLGVPYLDCQNQDNHQVEARHYIFCIFCCHLMALISQPGFISSSLIKQTKNGCIHQKIGSFVLIAAYLNVILYVLVWYDLFFPSELKAYLLASCIQNSNFRILCKYIYNVNFLEMLALCSYNIIFL